MTMSTRRRLDEAFARIDRRTGIGPETARACCGTVAGEPHRDWCCNPQHPDHPRHDPPHVLGALDCDHADEAACAYRYPPPDDGTCDMTHQAGSLYCRRHNTDPGGTL